MTDTVTDLAHLPALLILLALAAPAFAQSAAQPPSPAAALHALFDERYEWEAREFPETAMSRGDYRFADHISDQSLAAIDRRHAQTKALLARLDAIPREQLPENDQLNYDLFALQLRNDVDGHRFATYLQPVGGRFGPQQEIPQMHERIRFRGPLDHENYLNRLEQTPALIDQTIERMRAGVKARNVPPRVCVLGVPAQFDALLDGGGLDGLATPLQTLAGVEDPAQRDALKRRFEGTTMPAVRAAVARLGAYVRDDYLPACRESIAARDLPDGAAFYAWQLRVMTTTDLTAEQIHELGLREVARIHAEMLAVIRRTDYYATLPGAAGLDDDALFRGFLEFLRRDPRFYHKSEGDLLRAYRDICKRIDGELPRIFKTLPRLPYGVRKIPDFMAPAQTTAYYQPGDPRNAEAGNFYANTFALDQRPTYEMIALAMHEAVPGHHLQIALAQELADVPDFRRDMWFHVFGEGWALYSERLGIEMGLYADPYDDFGRLLYEMWRACRLVVDPGIHALGWSRERAVQFMLDNTALSPHNIDAEVDRYIAWPGQATAYKIGELKIRELRARAEQALGPRFDLREFHDVVLLAGSVPLTTLERRIDAWIARQRAE